jgi:hypothetical protein
MLHLNYQYLIYYMLINYLNYQKLLLMLHLNYQYLIYYMLIIFLN